MVWFQRQGREGHCSFCLFSLRSLTVVETSYHVMRTLKQPYGEPRGREQSEPSHHPREGAILKVDPPAPASL